MLFRSGVENWFLTHQGHLVGEGEEEEKEEEEEEEGAGEGRRRKGRRRDYVHVAGNTNSLQHMSINVHVHVDVDVVMYMYICTLIWAAGGSGLTERNPRHPLYKTLGNHTTTCMYMSCPCITFKDSTCPAELPWWLSW